MFFRYACLIKEVARVDERIAYMLVLSGAVFWGMTGTAQTFIPETVDSLVIATLRLGIGGSVLMLGLVLFRKLNVARWPWARLLVVAIVMALFQFFFFSSVRLTGVAVGTVVTIGSAPVFANFLEWLVLRHTPSRQWMIATAMAVLGSALLFLNKELVMVDSLGVGFAFVAGACFALYTFFNKKILETIAPIEAIAVVFTMSTVLLLPFSLFFSWEGLGTTSGLLAMLLIGLVTTALGYILFVTGLKYIPSSAATTLSLAEPFTATILSVVIVGEYLNGTAWVGVVLLMAGIVVLTIRPRNRVQT